MQPSDLRDNLRGFNQQPSYSTISVRVKSPKDVESVEQAIKKLGFNTFSILYAHSQPAAVFRRTRPFLGIFGSLALAVASIGIVNTLVMAILERRREIGIMKAIGASDGDVEETIFRGSRCDGRFWAGWWAWLWVGQSVESLISGRTSISSASVAAPENFWAVPWWLVMAAIALALIVSLVSGLYPAGARAARLDPVQAPARTSKLEIMFRRRCLFFLPIIFICFPLAASTAKPAPIAAP